MIPLSCVNVNGTDESFCLCVFTTRVSVSSTESLRTLVTHTHIFGECYTIVRKYEKFINTKFQRTLLRDYVHIMCRSHCFMCPRYTSCRRNLVVQDHVYMILYKQGPCTCYISCLKVFKYNTIIHDTMYHVT